MEPNFSQVDDETLESLFDETDDPDDIALITEELKRRAAQATQPLEQDYSDVGASQPSLNYVQEAVRQSEKPSKADAFKAWLREKTASSGIPMALDVLSGDKSFEVDPTVQDFATMIPRGQSYGLVDELGGLGAGFLSGLKKDIQRGPLPGADIPMSERGFDTQEYLDQRNMLRKEAERARSRSPNAAMAGEILGGFLTPGPKGTGFKGGAKAGALGGAVAGAGSYGDTSQSQDALELDDWLKGAVSGGAFGGAAGGALGGVSDALGTWLQKSSAINALKSIGLDSGSLMKEFPELKGMTSSEIDAWRRKLADKLSEQGVVRFGKGANEASDVLGGFTTSDRPLPDLDAATLAGFGDSTTFGGDLKPIPKPKFTETAPSPEQEEAIQSIMKRIFTDSPDAESGLLKDVPEYEGLVPEVPFMESPSVSGEAQGPTQFNTGEGYLLNAENPFFDQKTIQKLRKSATAADLREADNASLMGSMGPVGEVVEMATLSPFKRLAQKFGLNPPQPTSRASASASAIQRPLSQALMSETTDTLSSTAARQFPATELPKNSLTRLSEYLFGSTDRKSLEKAKEIQDEEARKNITKPDAGTLK